MVVNLAICCSVEDDDKALSKAKEKVRTKYGENKKITDGNYDKSLAVKCVNGTFVDKKNDGVIAYKDIPFMFRVRTVFVLTCGKLTIAQKRSW